MTIYTLIVLVIWFAPIAIWRWQVREVAQDIKNQPTLRQTIVDGVIAGNDGLTRIDGECVADVLIGYHGQSTLATFNQHSKLDSIYTPEVKQQLLTRCDIEFNQQ